VPGQGLHVVVPLVPETDWEEVKAFCQDFAELLARTDPSRFVATMSKARRKGRMFLDGQWSGRYGDLSMIDTCRSGAACAVPVSWKELPSFNSANAFDVVAAAERAEGRMHGTATSMSSRRYRNESVAPFDEARRWRRGSLAICRSRPALQYLSNKLALAMFLPSRQEVIRLPGIVGSQQGRLLLRRRPLSQPLSENTNAGAVA
jgi:hypothetical protein